MRKTLKKLFIPLLLLTMLAALCACGQGDTTTGKLDTTTGTSETPTGTNETPPQSSADSVGQPTSDPAHVHSYGEWTTVAEASCTEVGSKERVCACGDKQIETIPMTSHTLLLVNGKAATCTETGLTDGVKCYVCGLWLEEQTEIAALGHTEETVEGKIATCTETGLTEGKKCSVCGEILAEQTEIAALGHTEESIEGKIATCTEAGLTEGKKCSVCGKILAEQAEIAALGHTEETVEGKIATCTEAGLTEGKKCSVCGEILAEQTEIAALGHTEQIIEGKPATVTEDGLTEGKKCSVCGEILVEQTVIPATGEDGVDYSYYDLAGDYYITLWIPAYTGMRDHIAAQVAEFQKMYPYIHITLYTDEVGTYNIAYQIGKDIASAPDIYCFTQDQLLQLVQCGALSAPDDALADTLKRDNSASSVGMASVGDTLYAYPFSADNGYFMYYDKSILSEEDVEDLATIVSKVEASGLKIRFALENAWYNAAFFYATGCVSNWITDADGNWIGVEDTYNSENGLIAMKGMQILTQSYAYDSNADIFTDAAVVITGTWYADAAAARFGDNLAATDLPSFTVDGKSYHLSSYCGGTMMGVKPQMDLKKQAVLHLLTSFLTNEENQLDNYRNCGFGPSNLAAQADEAIRSNISLQALYKQNEYAVPQGNINSSWWDIAKLLGGYAKRARSESDLRDALNWYEEAICDVLNRGDEDLYAWGVIGSICGTLWDTDFPMTELADGSFLSDALYLNVGEEFKIRQGGSWDVNYGADGVFDGDNIVVKESGCYYIRLSFNGNKAIIELLRAALGEYDRESWGIIGSIRGTWWDTDFPMTEQEDGSFLSDALYLNEGDEFKIRYGCSWDVNYGADGVFGGDNIVVAESGYYYIRLSFEDDNAIIELISLYS